MKRRLGLLWIAAVITLGLMLPAATLGASAPYRWRVISNTCDFSMNMNVEFTVLGASRANKIIITAQVQQKNQGDTKWRNGRINGRSVEMFAANGQAHTFTREASEYLSYGYVTTLRQTMKLQAFKGRTLLWQKLVKGIPCQTTA